MTKAEKIWLSSPHMGGKELEYVQQVFESNWLAPLGPHVDGFEKDIEHFIGGGHVAVLSSGTAAIHLALILLGVKAGEEILVSNFTFSASVNPIIYQGANPIFIESESQTWNMSPVFLEQAIDSRIKDGKKPKAIILVHLYGMPALIEEIRTIADHYGIPIIEDAAEALGSKYKNRFLGTFGELGVYSFNGNKIITTTGGGALLSKSESIAEKARFLATQARDKAPHYQHSEIGYNYRLSNLCAAVGRGQMHYLADRVHKRRMNFEYYCKAFSPIDHISFVPEPDESFYSNRWLSTFHINLIDL